MGLAIAIRPPKFHFLVTKLRKIGGMEVDLALLATCEGDGFLEFDVANPTVQRAFQSVF